MNQAERMTIVSNAIEALETQNGRQPTPEQVQKYLREQGHELSLKEVKRVGDDVLALREIEARQLATEIAAFRRAMQEPEEEQSTSGLPPNTHITLSQTAQGLIHPTTGRLVIVQSDKAIELDAGEAWQLLEWLTDFHRDLLYQQGSKADEEAPAQITCDWCHKQAPKLYDVTPVHESDMRTISACEDCYEDACRELEADGYDLDLGMES